MTDVTVWHVSALVLVGTWLVGSAAAHAGEAADLETLYIITYDHCGKILWGEQRFMSTLRDGISWLDKYPDFKMGLDNEAYLYDYLAEQKPEMLEELRRDLKKYEGRLGVGTCTYGQPLSVFVNEESNVRQLVYGIRTCQKRLGYTPKIYLMSEHAMHSQIPQLLAGTGYQGAIMRTFFMAFGYNPTFDLPIGWWVGLDGTRVAAVPTYCGENAAFGLTTVDNWTLTRYPDPLVARRSLADFKHDFSRIKPLLAGRADDAVHRREQLVKEFDGRPGSGYTWILVDELLSLFPVPYADMKTAPNDFVVRMPWGACGNMIWNTTRQAEVLVCTAERLAAVALLMGAGNPHEAALEKAWKNVLVAQHHDITITFREDDAHTFVGASLAASGPVLDASLRTLAAGMKADGAAQLTVFNPCSWPRREWIEADVPDGLGAEFVTAYSGGKALPTVRLPKGPDADARDRLAVLADLPALGVAAFALKSADGRRAAGRAGDQSPPEAAEVRVDRANLRITTPDLDVRLNPAGGVESIVDRKSSASLLAAGKRSAFFDGRIDDKVAESVGAWEISVAGDGGNKGPWATARERGTVGGIPYTLEIRFRADTPELDCRAEFNFDGHRIAPAPRDGIMARGDSLYAHDEKLRFKVYPGVAAGATGIRDLPFAVAETPDKDVQGNYWTALADGKVGLAIFNRGNMGSCREADGGFAVPLAFTVGGGGGRGGLSGRHVYEFAIYPFVGEWQKADLHRRSIAYNFQPVAVSGKPGDGRWGDLVRPVSVDGEGVILSALYSEEGRVYARMYESAGATAKADLRIGPPGAQLVESDMLGRGDKPLSSPLSFSPWQIRTVMLTSGR